MLCSIIIYVNNNLFEYYFYSNIKLKYNTFKIITYIYFYFYNNLKNKF